MTSAFANPVTQFSAVFPTCTLKVEVSGLIFIGEYVCLGIMMSASKTGGMKTKFKVEWKRFVLQ